MKERARDGKHQCKICTSKMVKEIDVQILNGTEYSAIITRHKQVCPTEVPLSKPNLSTHKHAHLLSNPITKMTETEDGTQVIQTYITGHFEAQNIVIPPEAVPVIPSVADSLKIIIAAGLNNALTNPRAVSMRDTVQALTLLKQLGSGGETMDALLGSWGAVAQKKAEGVKRAKRTRTVTVSDEVEMPQPDALANGDSWGDEDLETLQLPPGSA